jgi:hypothetical protein
MRNLILCKPQDDKLGGLLYPLVELQRGNHIPSKKFAIAKLAPIHWLCAILFEYKMAQCMQ